jgi:prevent-host-death family protein
MVMWRFGMKTMTASKFKATCLAVMDEVEANREPVLLTKNGRPVAQLIPVEQEGDSLDVFLFPGGIEIHGDVMAPMYSDEENEEFFEREAEKYK